MDEKAIQNLVKAHPVVVFSKSYCPYCRRAKKALVGIGVHPVVVELDLREDGAEVQKTLLKMTNQRTVPNVWLNGKHFGGSDDTVKGVKEGKFDSAKGESKSGTEDAENSVKACGDGDGLPCKCKSGEC
mmetsp:Transcript_7014/g.9731  ORF Transcript_7014/g.9731 Transcript_7014/m.9731 type:complete len:129 (-) Transcript_7014:107-493(-)|eukprot:CAMPEP_0184479922 /NCGR_PEP_ID=MMETSP0113_2-20130426/1451_1 /TAXON_ID=91329 /ORGANISM="Norrisiella sphaerica, Strain BC52" /LENGTH=128 /DNA_ID=CAMNT_0026858093 /DNA_START=155 /DNA_END=541 /DNA_ORIENTATION=+